MNEIKFKRYNDQGYVWYHRYNPSLTVFPLKVNYNKFTAIGLSVKKDVPANLQVSYMGFTKYYPNPAIRQLLPEITISIGDTIECNGWKLKIKNQDDLLQVIENLKIEYYCQK